MIITKKEAGAALEAIVSSQTAMRQAIRAHAGHLYLWLWGGIWILMALAAEHGGAAGLSAMPVLCFAGVLASGLIGYQQRRQIRTPVDKRFLRVLASVLLFGVLFPFVLVTRPTAEMVFTYIGLLIALAYVVAGLWFDVYLLKLGLLLTALLLVGFWLATPIFWWWIAGAGGGTLIGAGFYVRYRWNPV